VQAKSRHVSRHRRLGRFDQPLEYRLLGHRVHERHRRGDVLRLDTAPEI
jgi:hypothetical protein